MLLATATYSYIISEIICFRTHVKEIIGNVFPVTSSNRGGMFSEPKSHSEAEYKKVRLIVADACVGSKNRKQEHHSRSDDG